MFVADIRRIARKYRTFAYRLSLLDAGVSAAQLAVVTAAAGQTVRFAPTWSTGLGDLLDLPPDDEAVTAAALITAAREGDGASDAAD